MRVLVAYASKYGATKEIAERLATRLTAAGHGAELRPVSAAGKLADYDAFVIGSAAYIGHWRKDAAEFVRRNTAALADRPTWLFSSGPLGTSPTDAKGRDQRVASVPKEIAEFEGAITPRAHHVFFGMLQPAKLGFRDRAIRTMPAGRALLPEGDFRDWTEIDGWATTIAHDLLPVAAQPH